MKFAKLFISITLFCILLTGCKDKDDNEDTLNNYVLDTAVKFLYDYCGYQIDLNDYYLVESSSNIQNEFPRDYFVLENNNPILSFTIIYSNEPLYGGYVYSYGDGQIAFSKYDVEINKDINLNNKTKIMIDNSLIKNENIICKINDIDGIKPISSNEIAEMVDFDYFDTSKNEVCISDPIINYYAQLENYPSYVNRKEIIVNALQDTTIRYLVLKDNNCIGIIEYDAYYENGILNQIKTNEINPECKFIITTNGANNMYYLTGDKIKDEVEINKYNRISNAFIDIYNELVKTKAYLN